MIKMTNTKYKWTWSTNDFYKDTNGKIERVTNQPNAIPHHLIPTIVENAGTWISE